MLYAKQAAQHIVGGMYPLSAVTSELKELGQALLSCRLCEVREETSDVAVPEDGD